MQENLNQASKKVIDSENDKNLQFNKTTNFSNKYFTSPPPKV